MFLSTTFVSHQLLGRTWHSLSRNSKLLVLYAGLMILALAVTFWVSIGETQTVRGVGIWAKPMKFMAATALFALTTVWLVHLVDKRIAQRPAFGGIAYLLIVTSLFEVAYITYQATQGEASHHNISDPVRAMLYGLMAIAAVGLTASQVWLAWLIWRSRPSGPLSVLTLSVLIALVFTFVLSTISGFMLGASQPPPGAGMPITGWHSQQDLRPAHFLAVHAQQLIPLLGLLATHAFGRHARLVVIAGSAVYLEGWLYLTFAGIAP